MVNQKALQLSVRVETWPIAGHFTISRGAKTEARVVVAELSDGEFQDPIIGRGECVPYARYGESVAAVAATLENLAQKVAAGLSHKEVQSALPAGAARNALDCAFWDLEAKRTGTPVYKLAGLAAPAPLITAFTISLGSPDAMAKAAKEAGARPLLKIKLGGEGDIERIAAIRDAVPHTELIIDANEGWTPDNLAANLDACAKAGVTLVEQPLHADADAALAEIQRPVPVCADESAHDTASLKALLGKYDAVNIKLDKTGGLTEALAMTREAQKLGLMTMTGCMVATSLSMAPAMLVAQSARFVDLDGPLLLARDRDNGLRYEGSRVYPPTRELWG
ncbi:N-acetyl-D-Glu racemase DgcA [Pseudorhodoplanes sinuspersici]|uniref:Dipeptide epimerase n=1 Tax=Pseudorhodoplanes sinuspersici TaxID=1235591 RepID=A0A1W6ZTV7_9HYPH|nr:N-acetyl-D-Glu racemase DgcA [Pseudorhodoplanes sinuspersici]ARQ00753.1 dipeptide epimerase [Pseudorhodoplanes sinuspersici]RKE72364.1 L-alanine-DL-glutamate epimerase-like enolase superfamily enzyme [Pseudorhodoplanes sinuspersici]